MQGKPIGTEMRRDAGEVLRVRNPPDSTSRY